MTQRAFVASIVFLTIVTGISAKPYFWDNPRNYFDTSTIGKPAIVSAVRSPRVNFSDGYELGLFSETDANQGSGKLLASGDFDSDGIADLITADTGGMLRFWKGNGQSVYPIDDPTTKSDEGSVEPFFDAKVLLDAPVDPDFLEAGDFNADGNLDLLVAKSGGSAIYLIAGNGLGDLQPVKTIDVAGVITALATGEIGRADGQADVAVAVNDGSGAGLLVFEHPTSAFTHPPERISIRASATEIAIGNLENDSFGDIVAAGGSTLTIIRGRGQVYPWDTIEDHKLVRPAPVVDSRVLPFQIAGLAIGYFTERRGQSIALLSDSGEISTLDSKPLARRQFRESASFTSLSVTQPVFRSGESDARFSKFRRQTELMRPLNDESELIYHPELIPGQLGSLDEIRAYQDGLAEKRRAAFEAMTPEARTAKLEEDRNETEKRKARTKRNMLAAVSSGPADKLASWNLEKIAADARLATASASAGIRKLVKVRVSDSGRDEFAMVDKTANQIHLIIRDNPRRSRDPRSTAVVSLDSAAPPVAVLPMRLNPDALSDLVILHEGSTRPSAVLTSPAATFTVTTLADEDGGLCDSSCSLREAIEAANFNAGTDTIQFAVSGVIRPTSTLPDIEFPVTLTGINTPQPQIEINGDLAGLNANGLNINSANVIVRNIAVTGFRKFQPNPDESYGGHGIAIYNFEGETFSAFNSVEGCYLGVSLGGSFDNGNESSGIQIFDSDNNTIGGTASAARNVISGNGRGDIRDSTTRAPGVYIVDGRSIVLRGNYIGTNAAGTSAIPNSMGVFAVGSNNEYGGDPAGSMNVISGNRHSATIPLDPDGCYGTGLEEFPVINETTGEWITHDNNIKGNRVGTNAVGNAAIGNCRTGIFTSPRTSAVIGSITPGGRNLVSGNNEGGIYCTVDPVLTTVPFLFEFYRPEGSTLPEGLCTILGNNVGTNSTGTSAIPNTYNHFILQAGINFINPGGALGVSNTDTYSTIGHSANTSSTSCTGACNLVAGETTTVTEAVPFDAGIVGRGLGTVGIFNNYSGVNITGSASLSNGVGMIGSGSLSIGALAAGPGGTSIVMGNLVSGNRGNGIDVFADGYDGNFGILQIKANRIGTDRTGLSAIPNGFGAADPFGLLVSSSVDGVFIIGGAQPGEGNVISGNARHGLGLNGSPAVATRNNLIGVNVDRQPLGNGGDGVQLFGTFNFIGDADAGNVIANNAGNGVTVLRNGSTAPSPRGNRIKYNSIFSNGGLGIDLSADTTNPIEGDGVTPNDCLDVDTGPHGLQNYPILTAPRFNGDGTVTVGGAFGSKASTTYTLDFYSNSTADPSDYGEGETYIGSTSVTTGPNGIASFLFTSSVPVASGLKITATAYDIDGNTSEFSCFAGQCSISGSTIEEQIESARAAIGGSACQIGFVVNINTDESDPNVADSICDVDLVAAGEQCSLRAAIQTTNAIAGTDIINFNIPGGGVQIITPQIDLPAITDTIVLNGDSQPGYIDKPLIQINGGAPGVDTGLNFATGSGNSTVDALSVNRFNAGIKLASDGNTVKRSLIGLDADGVTIPPNGSRQFVGIEITGKNNTVGGERDAADLAPGNSYVTGNTFAGVRIRTANATGNKVIGVNFGFIIDPKGTPPEDVTTSQVMIEQNASENTIGSLEPLERNLIINAFTGIDIVESAHDNLLIGNAIANSLNGIFIGEAHNNTIGGDHDSGARNFLMNNEVAILIGFSPKSPEFRGKRSPHSDSRLNKLRTASGSKVPSVGNKIYGNVIGLTRSGDPFLGPNDYGIVVALAEDTLIGSGTFGQHNFVSNNSLDGIVLTRDATGTKVKGNFVGTDSTGEGIAANHNGVTIYGSDNEITNNVLSGNNASGVFVSIEFEKDPTPTGNNISHNRIGTNGTGTNAIPNGLQGVFLEGDQNTLSENVISGNEAVGTWVIGDGNQITGNKIGTRKDGTGAIPNTKDGLVVTGNTNRIAGNTISGNNLSGLRISPKSQTDPSPDGNIVVGNKIGTNSDGTAALPNTLDGIIVVGATNTLIGGFGTNIPADRNVISGNTRHGIAIGYGSTATRVSGNYIGVNASGTGPVPNGGKGVRVGKSASNTIIGGPEPNSGNMIGYNAADGIEAGADPPPDPLSNDLGIPRPTMIGGGLNISGNFIGVVLGIGGVPAPGGNGGNGVSVDDFPGVVIGGDDANSGNIIGANVGAGIKIANSVATPDHPIPVKARANKIGTFVDQLGNLAENLGNAIGVSLENSANVEIGGTVGNLIAKNSGNGLYMTQSSLGTIKGNTIVKNLGAGIHLYRSSSTNIVQNAIGVVENLGLKLPDPGNGGDGVLIEESPANTIGGSISSTFNQIGNNLNNAIHILNTRVESSFPNEIQGNLIGAETANFGGLVRRASNATGVLVENSSRVKIGGTTTTTGNSIVANNGVGVRLTGSLTRLVSITNNVIGKVAEHHGTTSESMGNGDDGISIGDGANDNVVGGTDAVPLTGMSLRNVITSNGSNGIKLDPTAGNNNYIANNSIFGNTALGIDIGGPGLTPNDPTDADAGPNKSQNFPEIVSRQVVGGELIIGFRVDSAPTNSNYGANGLYVEFFKADGSAEGETFIGSAFYTVGDYNSLIPGLKTVNLGNINTLGIGPNDPITATATDADGNTSEFTPTLAPTAASVSISGRVLTATGSSVRGAIVTVTTANGDRLRARTNGFGHFRFESVEIGQTVIVAVTAKGLSFPSRSVTLDDEISGLEFRPDE